MADNAFGKIFASLGDQNALVSAPILLTLAAVLLVASTWLYSHLQEHKPEDEFPPWVALEIGVGNALLQSGGIASYILSVLLLVLK